MLCYVKAEIEEKATILKNVIIPENYKKSHKTQITQKNTEFQDNKCVLMQNFIITKKTCIQNTIKTKKKKWHQVSNVLVVIAGNIS